MICTIDSRVFVGLCQKRPQLNENAIKTNFNGTVLQKMFKISRLKIEVPMWTIVLIW